MQGGTPAAVCTPAIARMPAKQGNQKQQEWEQGGSTAALGTLQQQQGCQHHQESEHQQKWEQGGSPAAVGTAAAETNRSQEECL
jgi:hypothetical protein